MKTGSLLLGLTLALAAFRLTGATIIVNDNFTAANVNSGFLLNEGINSGINPPTSTRLSGTAAADLRYLRRGNKLDSAYTISGNKANISQGSQSGRFTISADGTTPFDFGPALGVASATPQNPVVYDITIAMNNKVALTDTSIGRMTFGFGTTEGGGGNWNFGIQIVPVAATTNYNVIKRIRTAASGLGAELNASMTNAGTAGNEISFLLRVTDAGAETGADYHSRVQVSMDGGATWFYDTQSDPSLVNGWRFDAATRFVSFDQAPNGGADTYDNFSIAFPAPLIWTGADAEAKWSTGANWLRGVPPVTGPTIVTGDALVFSGETQQASVNDISDLSVSSVTFSNGGFSLSGNSFTLTTAITNVVGDNALATDLFLGANGRFHSVLGNLVFNGGINSTGRNLTVSGTGSTIINGAISTGSGSLTKQTAGVLTLNGDSTYTGNTTISQGLLALNGSLASPSISIAAAGTLGGTGTVAGAVSVTGSLSAGNGVGKLTTGALTLNNNGTNVFEISSVTGTAGNNWDLVDAGINTVDVVATSANPFKFRVLAAGLDNFDKDSTYLWPAIAGSVQNFSADKFLVVHTGFTNDLAGGAFSIESDGTALQVRYVNNQSPTANPTNVTFAAGTSFQISIADLLANLTSDPDGDARTLVTLISTNAAVSTNATDITIFSANSSTESVAYVVRDVRNYNPGDTVRMATNYINIVVTGAPNGGTLTVSNNGGNANITFQGNPGQSYIIERSQDLITWFGIFTNTAAGNGAIQFSETPPTNPAFYRSRTE